MTKLLTTTAFAIALAAPSFAQNVLSDDLSTEQMLALDNDSAAERIIDEGSMGDIDQAQLVAAMATMSPAEKRRFFDAEPADRMSMITAKLETLPANSPAERAAAKEEITN